MYPEAKRFHPSLDFFKAIEQRAHAYSSPPKDFDPLTATDTQLERYGLPSRPDRDKEPDLFGFWTRLLGKSLEVVTAKFPEPHGEKLRSIPLTRVGRGEPRGFRHFERSRNWSGAYIVPQRPDMFVHVTGSWHVPRPSLPPVLPEGVTAYEQYQSSTWIGIDGHRRYPNSSMPQIGTSQCIEMIDGVEKISTHAWWQWWSLDDSYPPNNRNNPPVPITEIPVSLNDEMMAGVTVRSADEVHFYIKNQTTGLFTSFLVIAPGPILPLGATAEWIVERPTVIGERHLYPLPNYTDVVFRDCFAQSAPSIGAPAKTCRLRRARLIRMFETFSDPHRMSFVSLPRQLSNSSLQVSYRDASGPGSGGLLT
jgi:hypothetical protein